jgi:acyl-CoA synthetase (NDP forming)
MTPARKVYRHAEMKRLFHPASLAIVGISQSATSFGARTFANLSNYTGRLYSINPKYEMLYDRPCFPSLAALPEVPDCVLLSVPRDSVEAVLEECAKIGVGGAIIFAAGYAETGRQELVARQARITALARDTGMKIIGPNCQGLVNFALKANISFTTGLKEMPPVSGHAIGLASQSGALGFGLVQAATIGASFSHLMASGNSCDVDIADQIAYYAEEPLCQSIACVFEGMPEPIRMLEAAEVARAHDKPVVIFKLGASERGAAAAASHTGSLAGSAAAYKAAFDHAGFVHVENFDDLVETASFFAKFKRPTATGVAVMAASGGAAVMAADKAESNQVPLPQPDDRTRAELGKYIPDFGSTSNPADATAQLMNNPDALTKCLDAFLKDSQYGALVFPQPFGSATVPRRIGQLGDASRRHGKPVCVVFTSGWPTAPGSKEAEEDPNVAIFRSMGRCFGALAAWHRRAAHWQTRTNDRRDGLTRIVPDSAKESVASQLASFRNDILTEREAKSLLSAYGIPVVTETLVGSANEAVEAAAKSGAPVVLKVESPDLPHKTEAGVIRLNLTTPNEVRDAYVAIIANAKRAAARVNGVLVQPMIPSGVEMMVGARIDPLFGPLIMVGLGGILVELLKDTAISLAPVGQVKALAMLQSLRGAAMLNGFRGSEPVDIDKLAEVVSRLSELASDHKDRIAELDINPLICSGQSIVAVDALIVRSRRVQ